MPTLLTHEEALRFYDRFGAKQDAQQFYEGPIVDDLLAHFDLEHARAIVEFGCGTGRIAADILSGKLPPEARYLAIDASRTMVGLTRQRLDRFGSRVTIVETDGTPKIDAPDGSFDRFLSTYVFDLLSPEDIRAVLAEAHRVLAPGGLLGLAGLTRGTTLVSKIVTWAWEGVHSLRPALVGGCRPIAILDFLPAGRWTITHKAVITSYGLTSESLVARSL